jgi:hypothetical protein
MERTVEGPRGNEMQVQKDTDFDTGTRTTTRETSRGGSSQVTRQRQPGGGVTSSGTIETAGGKSATISGEHERGQGTTTITGEGGGGGTIDRERNRDGSVTREGSFSKDGQTIDTETRRDGRSSITKAEGSGGGSAISAKNEQGERTTLAQSGSGDLYAGHDGQVYRKTDDGWQKHENGGWSDVDAPDRPGGGERTGAANDAPRYGGSGSLESRESSATFDAIGNRNQDFGGAGAAQSSNRSGSLGNSSRTQSSQRNYDSLNRDASARHGSYDSFQRRSGGMSRGMGGRRR